MHLPLRAITVHTAARAGVSRAAQELQAPPSAVSQQIASLRFIGTSLMVKSGRRVVLTEAGERYFEMIAENIDRIADATKRSGVLVLEVPDRARHPEPVDEVACRASTDSMRTRTLTFASMPPTSRPILRARASISKSAMARETGPGFSSKASLRNGSCRCVRRPLRAGRARTVRSAELPSDPLGEIADAVGTLVRGRRSRHHGRRGAASCSTAATWRSTPP